MHSAPTKVTVWTYPLVRDMRVAGTARRAV
jgi:hypothetical protein